MNTSVSKELKDTSFHDQNRYFSEEGCYRLMIQALEGAVETIIKSPNSNNAGMELAWLKGVEENSLLSSSFCFESIGGPNIDTTREKFLKALDEDPVMLLSALKIAYKNLGDGNSIYNSDEESDMNISTDSYYYERDHG